MPKGNRLTASGLLYEGNREEWKQRLQAAISELGLEFFEVTATSIKYTSNTIEPWFSDAYRKASTTVLELIRCQVSPALMGRVPDADRKDYRKLMTRLLRLAQPFGLLELPPELRLRIYDHAIPSGCHYVDVYNYASIYSEPTPPLKLPSLVRTSRQIRDDTLPLAFSRTTINFYSGAKGPEPLVADVYLWAQQLQPNHIAYLKHISFKAEFFDEDMGNVSFEVKLTHSRATGVTSHDKGLDSAYSEERSFHEKWQEQLVSVNNTCRALHLNGGQALIMALTCCSELWDKAWLVPLDFVPRCWDSETESEDERESGSGSSAEES